MQLYDGVRILEFRTSTDMNKRTDESYSKYYRSMISSLLSGMHLNSSMLALSLAFLMVSAVILRAIS